MPDEKRPPTIPEIVRALTTIDDRHSQVLREHEQLHMSVLRRKEASLQTANKILERRDAEVTLLREVIEQLCERIERTQVQLRRDNNQCVYSEPLDIMNLLGRETDPSKIVTSYRDKKRADAVKQARKSAGAPEPCGTQLDAGPCAGTRRHPGDCTANADDIPSTQEDKAVECDCGQTWRDGVMGVGHGDMQCYAMEKPCRICGHPEERHTRTLPEEGNKAYCAECGWADEHHEFDGGKLAEGDVCNCGCIRRHHTDGQCSTCPGDSERSFRHEFMLRTEK